MCTRNEEGENEGRVEKGRASVKTKNTAQIGWSLMVRVCGGWGSSKKKYHHRALGGIAERLLAYCHCCIDARIGGFLVFGRLNNYLVWCYVQIAKHAKNE